MKIMERNLSQHQQMLAALDNLLDVFDNLSIVHCLMQWLHRENSTYSYWFVRNLTRIWSNIRKGMAIFDLPLVNFGFEANLLAIRIPGLTEYYTQKALELFHLESVPVVFHINHKIFEADESKMAYTWIKPEHLLLAMTDSTCISLDRNQIQKCIQVVTKYFCKNLFCFQHTSEYTCKSAIHLYQGFVII